MTTPTCTVCGATEPPDRDHTCPVCGADLPEVPAPADGDGDPEGPVEDAPPPAVDEAPAAHGQPASPPPPGWPTASTPVPPPPPTATAGVPRSTPSPHDPSHPSGLSSSLRTYGMLTHLSAFLSAMVALAFLGPLVMWLIRRDEHPFLDHHGKEAVNFNLSMLLYLVVGFVVSVATLGIGLVVVAPAAAVFFVTWVAATIIAAVKANAGEGYRYPLCIRFIRD